MESELCPRCKESSLDPVATMNAVSRRDKKTYICSDCGLDEALIDFFGGDEDLSWLKETELKEVGNEGYI